MILQHDKALHIIAGVLVYAVAHFISPVVGLWAVVLVGFSKEVYDAVNHDRHTPDVMDFLATCFGGFLGFICGA